MIDSTLKFLQDISGILHIRTSLRQLHQAGMDYTDLIVFSVLVNNRAIAKFNERLYTTCSTIRNITGYWGDDMRDMWEDTNTRPPFIPEDIYTMEFLLDVTDSIRPHIPEHLIT